MQFTFSDDHAKLIFAEYISQKFLGGQRVGVGRIKQDYDKNIEVEAMIGAEAEAEEEKEEAASG